MLTISSRVANGPIMEISQADGRRRGEYQVFANGLPVGTAKTILKAKRAANAFAGRPVFDLKEARVHA